MKLKAISKAMRGKEAKKPGKTYVVSKKGGGTKGAKGVKLVDRREKSDKRALERITKRKGTLGPSWPKLQPRKTQRNNHEPGWKGERQRTNIQREGTQAPVEVPLVPTGPSRN